MAVQQAAPSIGKSAENPHFKFKYADLPAIWEAIRPILGENHLIVTNILGYGEEGDHITTTITHIDSGEFIESKSKIYLNKITAQEYGSYITYMRRYALSAMLGLVTDKDDDGNAASQVVYKRPEPKPEMTEEERQKKEDAWVMEQCATIFSLNDLAALEKVTKGKVFIGGYSKANDANKIKLDGAVRQTQDRLNIEGSK